jgi:hypothetical protein
VWSQLTRGIDRKIAKNSRFYLKAPVPHTHTHTHTQTKAKDANRLFSKEDICECIMNV